VKIWNRDEEEIKYITEVLKPELNVVDRREKTTKT
jgi:hypothetical protein